MEFKFPAGFLWGAATSGHQVEGDNTNSDWWAWESEKRVKTPSLKACDHYIRYKEDFELAKSLGHNAHRFSLEWSRIEPEEGAFDQSEIAHYRDVIRTLRSLRIEPIVTINHFTLPLWLHKKGGWLYNKSAERFARFSGRVAEELGEDVTYWITINEPAVLAHASYIEGKWPPGRSSFLEATRVLVMLMKAHALSYLAVHEAYSRKKWPRPKLSIAKHVLYLEPCRKDSRRDKFSVKIREYYFSRLFIEALIKGRCAAPGLPFARLAAKNTLDFIGINYYTRDFVHYAGLMPPKIFGNVCTMTHHESAGRRTSLKWEIYPEGICEILKKYTSLYSLPALITENGLATDNDNDRIYFIEGHVRQIGRAIREGAPVLGYLHWSLLDNFEWADGYGPTFGIVEVDYATQKRRVRKSAKIYAEIIRKNAISLT